MPYSCSTCERYLLISGYLWLRMSRFVSLKYCDIVVGLTTVSQKITDTVRSQRLASFTVPKVNDDMTYT